MRALLDTNVLISSLLPSTHQARTIDVIVDAALGRAYTLLLPPDLLDELADKVAASPFLAARITAERIDSFSAALRASAEPLPPLAQPPPPLCRDPDDDYLLAYAEQGRADYLVTGDDDLLALKDLDLPFDIVSPAEFLSILREAGLI